MNPSPPQNSEVLAMHVGYDLKKVVRPWPEWPDRRIRLCAMHNCSSVKEYIKLTKMNKPHVWGTDIELLVVAHLLKTCIHFYMTREQKWFVYRPSTLDKALAIDSAAQAIYLRHPPFHYDVVLAVSTIAFK